MTSLSSGSWFLLLSGQLGYAAAWCPPQSGRANSAYLLDDAYVRGLARRIFQKRASRLQLQYIATTLTICNCRS